MRRVPKAGIAFCAFFGLAVGEVGAQSSSAGGSAVLEAIDVSDDRPQNLSKDENATEGSNSYTTTNAGVGSKSGAPIRQTPQSISVLTRKQLDDQNLSTVEDAMRTVTGMVVQQIDAGRSDIVSRGYRMDSIQVDGVTTSMFNNFFSLPDLYLYDRVEVLRGPNALFAGAGNPSGSINLVRKRALDIWQFQNSLSYGTNDAKRGEFDLTGPITESKHVRARLVGIFEDKELFYKPSITRSRRFTGRSKQT